MSSQTRLSRLVHPTALVMVALTGACTRHIDFTRDSPDGAGAGGGPGGIQRGALTFEEDCSGPLNGNAWRTEMIVGTTTFRSWGGRADWMADTNVSVRDGWCMITAENRPAGDRNFTSGVMSTGGLFEQRFGVFEVRMRAPAGAGFWPVFSLRALDGWPPAIDVVSLDGQHPDELGGGFWFAPLPGMRDSRTGQAARDWADGFHTYSVRWTATEIIFYFDEQEWFRVSDGLEYLRVPLHPVINLSIFDGINGALPDATTPWPGQLTVDWVRVYLE